MLEIKDSGMDEGFQGPVRSIRIEVSKISKHNDSYVEGPRVLLHSIALDKEGRKIEEIEVNVNDLTTTRSVYSYDIEGLLTVKQQYHNERPTTKMLYSYDAAGRLIEETNQTLEGMPLNRTSYAYDAEGNNIEVANYQPSGLLSARIISRYDDKGRLIEAIFCGGHGSGIITRSGEGVAIVAPANRILKVSGDPCRDGLLISRLVVHYHEQQGETEVIRCTKDDLPLSRTITTGNTESEHIIISQYEANGSLQDKQEHHRTFDTHDNWIKDTKSVWDAESGKFEPSSITYRTITYY